MNGQKTITLHASDISGQKMAKATGVPVDATVGEVVQRLLAHPNMTLPRNDASGPLAYHAILDREGRNLQPSEVVRDALQDEDRIVLLPNNINAG
jgi:hypothetical protein